MSRVPPPMRVVLGLVVVAVIGWSAWLGIRDTEWWDEFSEDATAELPSDLTEVLSTAVVTRANVADENDLTGELRYQDAVTFAHRIDPDETVVTQVVGAGRAARSVSTVVQEPGSRAVTALPTPGQVIAPGDVLYESDSTSVYTALGNVAAWRTMGDDMSGDDIAQLQRHLLDGGWGDEELIDDGAWSSATTVAVEQWQDATEQEVTGEVELGDIWFIAGPIRITEIHATEGLVVSDGDELFAYTADERSIEANVIEVPEGLLTADDLTARLPDGSLVAANLQSVRGATSGFDIVLDVDLPPGAVPVVDGIEITTEWTVNELVDSLTVPPEAIRRLDDGSYVVDVLDGDVIRTTTVEVLGSAGRVVAIDGVPELTRVLVP
ncbi:MAG: hypothetical protein HKN94_03905 [Acidimicrobiales bacterium]|nr:hypothetical protein [Acidimicrobiia bacterium]NNC79278.1 hypothetical protein [Acidimicrobiales bacterium]